MTLVVGSKTATAVWLACDTAITGGPLGTRDREYQIKVVPALDNRALIGFAGDQHHGNKLAQSAGAMASGPIAIEMLKMGTAEYPSVEIAYAYMKGSEPHLLRVSNGKILEVQAVNLGSADAFEQFQRIRHSSEIAAVPKAFGIFFMATRCPDPIPDQMRSSVSSMFRLFVERTDRDVGGWVVPYVLTKNGTFLCGYGYSISDPIIEEIDIGTAIPHGTAERGGFGISLTEFGHGEGIVLYWLQRKQGTIFRRIANGYELQQIGGSPAQFIRAAELQTGRKVEIMFGEEPLDKPDRIIITHDESGKPAMAIAVSGRTLSFAALNLQTEFRTTASVDLETTAYPRKVQMSWGTMRIKIADDGESISLDFEKEGSQIGPLTFNAQELSDVVKALGEVRTALAQQVDAEPSTKPGDNEAVMVDPAWRTSRSMHDAMHGIVLRLRHLGFGWLTFLLPEKEAKNLGTWLVQNAEKAGD